MERISVEIVNALRSGGVSANGINTFLSEVSEYPDNLEMLGLYWVSKITNLNINIRTHADVCLFLRDTVSDTLWMSYFKQHVVPIIVKHNILT